MILDVMMPDVDGYDVLEARRERGLAPHTHVLMLTCKTDERDLVRSWALGADAYLSKPTDPELHRRQAPGAPRDGRRLARGGLEADELEEARLGRGPAGGRARARRVTGRPRGPWPSPRCPA